MKVNHILHGHEKQVRVRDLIPDLKHCRSYGCQFPKHLNSCCIEEPRPAPSTNLEYSHTLDTSYPYAWKIGEEK